MNAATLIVTLDAADLSVLGLDVDPVDEETAGRLVESANQLTMSLNVLVRQLERAAGR